MGKSRGIQLDLSKRMVISNCLREEMSLIQIAKLLNYHSSTISREIKKYRTLEFREEKKLSICSRCLNNAICRLHHRCGDILCNQMCCGCKILKVCDKQKLFTCNIVRKFPFVCDGCTRKRNCKLNHYRYDAKEADKNSS